MIILILLVPSAITIKSNEVPSPGNWIKQEYIHVYDDRIVIDIENAFWAYYLDSNSMDPVLDNETNGIYIVPESEDDIHVGDIVSLNVKIDDYNVCHRVVEITHTDKGKKFITKGDNNHLQDPYDTYFEDINGVLVILVY